jgi:hypothetical protein
MGNHPKDGDFFNAQFFAFHVKQVLKIKIKMEDYL